MTVRTDRGFWSVADGMGGHEAGDVASAKVTDALTRLPTVYRIDDLIESAIAALKRVNAELIEMARSRGTGRSIGSTVVGIAVANGEYRCFWAGDSRAYRIRTGQIVQLSRDHSLVQELVDTGMLDANSAGNHPNANVITRAVGASEDLDVDTVAGDAATDDLFLLASDGLTRLVDDVELLDTLSSGSLEAGADRLVEMCLERGAPDNITLILVKLR